MLAVITADIEESRKVNSNIWLSALKKTLNRFGREPKIWDIYRGDSFQLEIKDPALALQAAILIKATIKQIKPLDVRIAIGIGEKENQGKSITESNGSAYIHSGEQFEQLKENKVRLAIKTPWTAFDTEMNVMLNLASVAMDHWLTGSAEVMYHMLLNPELQKQEVAQILGIGQNAVSGRLKRAHFNEIIAFEALFQLKLKTQINTH